MDEILKIIVEDSIERLAREYQHCETSKQRSGVSRKARIMINHLNVSDQEKINFMQYYMDVRR